MTKMQLDVDDNRDYIQQDIYPFNICGCKMISGNGNK